jgi:hypothetical protein
MSQLYNNHIRKKNRIDPTLEKNCIAMDSYSSFIISLILLHHREINVDVLNFTHARTVVKRSWLYYC